MAIEDKMREQYERLLQKQQQRLEQDQARAVEQAERIRNQMAILEKKGEIRDMDQQMDEVKKSISDITRKMERSMDPGDIKAYGYALDYFSENLQQMASRRAELDKSLKDMQEKFKKDGPYKQFFSKMKEKAVRAAQKGIKYISGFAENVREGMEKNLNGLRERVAIIGSSAMETMNRELKIANREMEMGRTETLSRLPNAADLAMATYHEHVARAAENSLANTERKIEQYKAFCEANREIQTKGLEFRNAIRKAMGKDPIRHEFGPDRQDKWIMARLEKTAEKQRDIIQQSYGRAIASMGKALDRQEVLAAQEQGIEALKRQRHENELDTPERNNQKSSPQQEKAGQYMSKLDQMRANARESLSKSKSAGSHSLSKGVGQVGEAIFSEVKKNLEKQANGDYMR